MMQLFDCCFVFRDDQLMVPRCYLTDTKDPSVRQLGDLVIWLGNNVRAYLTMHQACELKKRLAEIVHEEYAIKSDGQS